MSEDFAKLIRESTDPSFVRQQLGVPSDGRNRRVVESKRVIVDACRYLMMLGIFRPTMDMVCATAIRAVRTGFQLFGSIEALHLEALKDGVVREAILRRVLGQDFSVVTDGVEGDERILQAIITGRG